MKTIEVDGHPYRIKILPPWLLHYVQRYNSLMKETPETEEDEAKLEGKIKRSIQRLLSVADPYPPEEDATQVFFAVINHLNEYIAEVNEEAKFFRKVEAGD